VPPIARRLLAAVAALTWLVFPGFGLIDLSVSWDADWPVALEAGWGVFATVVVAGAFVAVAVRPDRAGPSLLVLGTALAALLVAAAAGLEWQLLGYAGVLALETAPLLIGREPLRRPPWRPSWPLLAVAVLGLVPWSLEAGAMFRLNRADAGARIGEHTMGVDHHAVQGALALAVALLAVLAAVEPRGRAHLGLAAGLSAAYLGLVSWAFPDSWASLSPLWSALCVAWGVAVAGLAAIPSRSPMQPRAADIGTASAHEPLAPGTGERPT
jgi:hypothetical protein